MLQSVENQRRDSPWTFSIECFNTSLIRFRKLLRNGLWSVDERAHYVDLRGLRSEGGGGGGVQKVRKMKWRRKLRPPAALRRCEGPCRFQCSASVPWATREAVWRPAHPRCTKEVLCSSCTHTETHTAAHDPWSFPPRHQAHVSEAPAYKCVFADSLLVCWAAGEKSEEL